MKTLSHLVCASRLFLVLGSLAASAAWATGAQADSASQPTAGTQAAGVATSRPAGNLVVFQPGIRIDYARRQVEVDAKVVMREGPLELFACCRGTREYESIVAVQTRPLFVYQALGLLGLTPGHPVRMRPDGRIDPAEGDPVELEISFEEDGKRKAVPVEAWLKEAKSAATLPAQPWVFAGSFVSGEEGIGADEEGTVVAVVDFESAIIALPRHHTASNAELWLQPNTPAIPEVGTACVLVFRPGPWRLSLDESGRLFLGGRSILMLDAGRRLQQALGENPKLRVEIEMSVRSPASERRQLQRMLEALHVQPIELPATQPSESRPAALHVDPQRRGDLLYWVAAQLSANDDRALDPAR